MKTMKDWMIKNIKVVGVVVVFFLTLYVQHVTNSTKISDLEHRCNKLETKIDDQYRRLDEIKVDKETFQYVMSNINEMNASIKEIQTDIKVLLKDGHFNKK